MKAWLARYWVLVQYTAKFFYGGIYIIWSREFRLSPGRIHITYSTGIELAEKKAAALKTPLPMDWAGSLAEPNTLH